MSILGDFLAVFGVINLITFKWHGTPLQVTNVMLSPWPPGMRQSSVPRHGFLRKTSGPKSRDEAIKFEALREVLRPKRGLG